MAREHTARTVARLRTVLGDRCRVVGAYYDVDTGAVRRLTCVASFTPKKGHRDLLQAFASLPGRCRHLLGLLAQAPELTYPQLGRALGINVNSIGQTRGRCLALLRRRLAMLDIREESAG